MGFVWASTKELYKGAINWYNAVETVDCLDIMYEHKHLTREKKWF